MCKGGVSVSKELVLLQQAYAIEHTQAKITFITDQLELSLMPVTRNTLEVELRFLQKQLRAYTSTEKGELQ